MNIGDIYLSNLLLCDLRDCLSGIDGELYEALDYFLDNTGKIGEYLENIFYSDELSKLEKLDKEYGLFEKIGYK